MSSRRAASVSRTCAASRSPPSRRWYSLMPRSVKAQARGDVVSRTAGRARSKCAAAHTGRSGRRDRPTQVPSAHSARPCESADPTLLQPAAVEPQEVAEPFRLGVERGLEKCGVPCREPLDLRPALPEFLQQHREQQRAGVVVGAVSLVVIGNGVCRVLEHPGRVGHPRQGGRAASRAGRLAVRPACAPRAAYTADPGAPAASAERIPCSAAPTAPRSSRGRAGTLAHTSRRAAVRRRAGRGSRA